MTLVRLIPPKWLQEKGTTKIIEGLLSDEQIADYNIQGYNIHYWPNYPSDYDKSRNVDGSQIDIFDYVFVDFDLKTANYPSKDAFIEELGKLLPSRIVDSGGGIHAYWKVSDLDAKSYLRLTRRLVRFFNTDPATGTLAQLMRLPGTLNTKQKDNYVLCETLHDSDEVFTCEQLDKLLPGITVEDEEFCNDHYNKTHNPASFENIDDTIPPKFGQLLSQNAEAKELWALAPADRSKADYRLGHIMFANSFTRQEAISVLMNSGKAMSRSPVHRVGYAQGIVDKIWTYELEDPKSIALAPTVRELLSKGDEVLTGTRFPCHRILDDTYHGFRLGQVMGIIGGSGVGKTTLTLNTFLWFAANNPDYQHYFFSLEQPPGEIAARIRTICQGNEVLYDKIHIVSNYDENGEYRNLSIDDVESTLKSYEKESGKKVGAVVVDHIGVLAKNDKHGENEGLIGICKRMKAVAVNTNIFLIMLSQAPREKAGVGDLELDKNAAYGTVFFEAFVDFLLCLWQPLKRAYTQGAPTVMAFKFAKIRHKKQQLDKIHEDTCYQLYFDPNTEILREMTQDEETAASYYLNIATNMRKRDRKTDLVPYQSRKVDGKANSN